MTITNITIKDNTVTITGTGMTGVDTVYIDNIQPLYNILNLYTTKTHDTTITTVTSSDTSIIFDVDDYTRAGIIITVSDISVPLINFYSIYKAKINYINDLFSQDVCRNCIEKRFNISTLTLLLRDNLLNEAYNLSKFNDVITYYNLISKNLDFSNIIWDTADNDTITYIQFNPTTNISCSDCSTCKICNL